jgi:hypothetical protein
MIKAKTIFQNFWCETNTYQIPYMMKVKTPNFRENWVQMSQKLKFWQNSSNFQIIDFLQLIDFEM